MTGKNTNHSPRLSYLDVGTISETWGIDQTRSRQRVAARLCSSWSCFAAALSRPARRLPGVNNPTTGPCTTELTRRRHSTGASTPAELTTLDRTLPPSSRHSTGHSRRAHHPCDVWSSSSCRSLCSSPVVAVCVRGERAAGGP